MQQHTVQTPYMVGEVHFYTAELEGGLVMFDTGPPTPDGEAYLLENIDLKRLKCLFISHCHVDHYGLANFILHHSQAEVFIPRRDAIKFQRYPERMDRMAELLAGYGFGADFAVQLKETFNKNKVKPTTPERFRIVEESNESARLGVSYLACPGHSQSDLVYLVEDCAVSGDILLRNIFQAPILDIDLESFAGRYKNYQAYCSSLLNLATLRGRRIMPGHRQAFEGVDEAILFYVTTLLERSVQILPYRMLPLKSILEQVFNGRLTDTFFIFVKISEIVFMLDFIENPQFLKDSLVNIGLFEEVRTLYEAVAQ
jgi:2,4-dienoyl-CoA reductase (NADPH2)